MIKVSSRIFEVWIDHKHNKVIKKIRTDKIGAHSVIYKSLKKSANYKKYYNVLSTLERRPFIGKYIVPANEIQRDGSYTSPLIKGIIFEKERGDHHLIRCQQLTIEDYAIIIKLMRKLLKDLREYTKVKKMRGDWALRNLMYDTDNRRIVNIDCEGFYTYPYLFPKSPVCQYNAIKDSLEQLEEELIYAIGKIYVESK